MAITSAVCNSFKTELAAGTHVFGTDVFKIALFTSAASLDKTTTAYAATNEASGTGYSAGGATLTSVTASLSGDTLVIDAADASWAAASITARGALIYNSSKSNKAVAVLNFGSDITSTAGTFLVTFDATGIVRLT